MGGVNLRHFNERTTTKIPNQIKSIPPAPNGFDTVAIVSTTDENTIRNMPQHEYRRTQQRASQQ